MQIVVTVVQNAIDRRDMGSGTSSVTFFRLMGGAFGTAIFGAVLTNRLGHYLSQSDAGSHLPPGVAGSRIANNVQAIQALPAQVKEVVIDAWVRSVHEVCLVAFPFVLAAVILALFIPELELKQAGGENVQDEAP